jgi:hypothetical protein
VTNLSNWEAAVISLFLPALPRLLLAAALVLLVGLLAALMLLVRLLAAALLRLARLLAAALLLLARAGIARLLTRILTWIVRIGHSCLLEGSGFTPGPERKRPKVKRVRGSNDQLCGTIP